MKNHRPDTTPSAPRRRWLGAFSAAAAAVLASRARSAAPATGTAALTSGQPDRPSVSLAARSGGIAVKPSLDSVKRHG